MSRRLKVKPTAALGVLSTAWQHPANKDARLSAVGRTLLYQAQGRLFGRSTIVPLGRSSRVTASFDDVGSRRAAYSRLPDFAEMSVWLNTLAAGNLFVDVGANVGLYSVLAAECRAHVISFEPLPEARRQLEANLDLNGYEAKVHAAAVADQRGTMTLDGVDAQRMHLTGEASPTSTEVAVVTLDEVLGDRTVDGLKIDVEGAEQLVLKGAANALRDQRLRLIQLEWNDTSMENFGETREPVAELLTAAGYELLRPSDSGELQQVTDLSPGADVFARPAN